MPTVKGVVRAAAVSSACEATQYVLNIYSDCKCECTFCSSKYHPKNASGPRPGILDAIRENLKKLEPKSQILVSWRTDPYSPGMNDDNRTTRQALEILFEGGYAATVLTKNLTRALRDVDLFRVFGEKIKVATSFSFSTELETNRYENGTESFAERVDGLKTLKENRISTQVFLKPIVDSFHVERIIDATYRFADAYFVGGYVGMKKTCPKEMSVEPVGKTVRTVVDKLRNLEKPFYVETTLRSQCPEIDWRERETNRASLWIFLDETPFWFG